MTLLLAVPCCLFNVEYAVKTDFGVELVVSSSISVLWSSSVVHIRNTTGMRWLLDSTSATWFTHGTRLARWRNMSFED